MRLLKLKQRPQQKGLILIAAKFHQVAHYLQPMSPSEQVSLINNGDNAITYLMPTRSTAPRWLRGKHNTLAIRLTSHPSAKQLCLIAGSALVSTSANLSGQRPAKTYAACQRQFGKAVWVMSGKIGNRKQPSTIRSWLDGKIVRQ